MIYVMCALGLSFLQSLDDACFLLFCLALFSDLTIIALNQRFNWF